ncbi:7TM chemoreceptor [Trichostrongylus colubriformis]|uniref:7TM chemoreceptor n=1 Tax=Trichostrongylus colubriformis TaxID=6319 RepID=A0AAN8FGZ5_TRICO
MLNMFLIYVIRTRATRFFGAYKYIMIACAVYDTFLSVIDIVCSPTFAATPEMSALLIVNGGFVLPTIWGCLLLMVFVFLLCNSIVIPPCLFVFRYLQICRASYLKLHGQRLCFFLVLPFIFSTSICCMICFAAWPTESDILFFTDIAYDINVEGHNAFLVATLKKQATLYEKLQSHTLLAGTISVISLLMATMAAITFCAHRIAKTVKVDGCVVNRRLNTQLRRLLFAQAALPFLLLHLPFYVSVLGPLFEARTGEASNYFPFLFSWFPALNPLIPLYFVKDFRKFSVSIFKKKTIRGATPTPLRTR